METQKLIWLSVEITPENIEELEQLTGYSLKIYVFTTYHIHTATFQGSHNLVPNQEKVIPDFNKLPELKLMVSLGMSHREAFKELYGET